MPKKPKGKPARKPISDAQRAADERLRNELRNADMGKFEKVVKKAIRPRHSERR